MTLSCFKTDNFWIKIKNKFLYESSNLLRLNIFQKVDRFNLTLIFLEGCEVCSFKTRLPLTWNSIQVNILAHKCHNCHNAAMQWIEPEKVLHENTNNRQAYQLKSQILIEFWTVLFEALPSTGEPQYIYIRKVSS